MKLDSQHLILLDELLRNPLFEDLLTAYAEDFRMDILPQIDAAHNLQNSHAAANLFGSLRVTESLHSNLLQFFQRQLAELKKKT